MRKHRTNICVLGATGFVGQHLVENLLAQGHNVSILSRISAKDARVRFSSSDVRWVVGDWRQSESLKEAMKDAEICFHLISTTLPRSSNEDPVYDVTSNVCGSIEMLQTAVNLGCRKVVFISSGGTIYGIPQSLPITELHPLEPNSSYGIGKLAIEKYLRLFSTLYGLDYGIVRLANPYGEGQQLDRSQGAVSVFLDRTLSGKAIEIWGDGSVVRDYIYITDAVDGITKVASYAGVEKIFNIGSGSGLSLIYILGEIEKLLNKKANVKFLAARPFDVPSNVLSIDRAKALLHFRPTTSFNQGLDLTASWQKQVLLESKT